MSNQLRNHKNVLGSSSQGRAIILVPALPGLPIHPFLAEPACLPIPFSSKKKKSACRGQLLRVGPFSLQLPSSDWYPMGKGGACVGIFSFPTSNVPASCQRLSLPLFFPGFSHQELLLSSLPLQGFPKKFACVYLETGKPKVMDEWLEKEWRAELAARFTHFASLVSVSWVTLTVAHTVGCQHAFLPEGWGAGSSLASRPGCASSSLRG